jgi:hypothetical protein
VCSVVRFWERVLPVAAATGVCLLGVCCMFAVYLLCVVWGVIVVGRVVLLVEW